MGGKKRSGILRVTVTCFVLRILLTAYTVFISSFPRLDPPKYQRDVTLFNPKGFGTQEEGAEESIFVLRSRGYLKGKYSFPVTTFFGFLDYPKDGLKAGDRFGNLPKAWLKLIPFTSWDAERFLKTALNDLVYTSLDSCAFFSLFPLLLRSVTKALVAVLSPLVGIFDRSSEVFLMVLVGVVLNNVTCVLGCILVYLILLKLLRGKQANYLVSAEGQGRSGKALTECEVERIAYLSCFVYNLSPGFVFTTALYTEPVYSLLCFTAILYFLNAYNAPKTNLALELGVVFLIFLNGFTRSNTVLFVLPLFFYTLKRCPLVTHLRSGTSRRSGSDRYFTSKAEAGRVFLLAAFHWFKSLLYAAFIALPFLLTQFYGYFVFCNKTDPKEFAKLASFKKFVWRFVTWVAGHGDRIPLNKFEDYTLDERRWCTARLPSVYGYVQNKYWGVKFLYTFSSLENFTHLFYTFPTICVILLYIYHYLVKYFTLCRDLVRNSKLGNGKKVALLLTTIIDDFEFGLFLHLAVTLGSFLLFSHIQIVFRQSLGLIQYLLQFSVLLNCLASGRSRGRKMRLLCLILFLYNAVLCFVGIILFSNFIGWT